MPTTWASDANAMLGNIYVSLGKLAEAADVIIEHPIALQLRNLQVLAEIAIEKNSTILFPLPMEILRYFDAMAKEKEKGKA